MEQDDKWEVIPEGEPNFYIIKNKKDWLFRVQVNGKLLPVSQIELLKAMINKIENYLKVKNK